MKNISCKSITQEISYLESDSEAAGDCPVLCIFFRLMIWAV